MAEHIKDGRGNAYAMVVNLDGSINTKIVSPLESNGAIPVNIQDQTSPSFTLFLNKTLDTITVLANTSIDDETIDIETTGVVPVVGNYICLKELSRFFQARIISVTPIAGNQYTLGLEVPLDFDYTTAGGCSISTIDMNIDASGTQSVFKVSPVGLEAGIQWDITKIRMIIEDVSAMDSSTFGGISGGLTNGIYGRIVNGSTYNFGNVKKNGDFSDRGFTNIYDEKAPSGVHSLTSSKQYAGQSEMGVTIRLSRDTNDEFQVILRDDLTDLTKFRIMVQGHVVTD